MTVLFCDVTGSTSLGESVDPEALRALLARYFERMKTIVERHGGTVEKFIGDSVMAVFGVPRVHEDDALRALRAAAEMRDALGYHLEQSARYTQELGSPDARLAERAAERLGVAGRRALWRGDDRAAALVLERAIEVRWPRRLDLHSELDLARSLYWVDLDKALARAENAAARARAGGDQAGDLLARTVAAFCRALSAADPDIEALATLAGQGRSQLFSLPLALVMGPRPADEALRRLDAALLEAPNPNDVLARASLLAMLGHVNEARAIAREASARLREMSGHGGGHRGEVWLADIAILSGDHDSAIHHLRRLCKLLEATGRRSNLSVFAPRLGRELCAQGLHDGGEAFAQLGRELAAEQDVLPCALWRQTQALVHASRGRHVEAELLANEALAILERTTDALTFQGDAHCDHAEVLAADGSGLTARTSIIDAAEQPKANGIGIGGHPRGTRAVNERLTRLKRGLKVRGL